MPNKYSSVLNYVVEYLIMVLISISVVGITSGSHSIGLPLYKINPMHWVVYFAILLRKPSVSSIIILAFALPLTSNILTGHPIIIKSMIMGVELSIYGLIFLAAIKFFNLIPVIAYLISQVTGRFVYYGLKYVLIKAELIDSFLVSTSLILQITIFVALGMTLFYIDKKRLTRKLWEKEDIL
jgi:hypothetical protein